MSFSKVKISFFGGVEGTTGANYLLEIGDKKILVDCGLFQGSRIVEKKNYEPFPYDPSTIDFLFVTHAHLDHIGRIPKLVRDGFKGKIYSTFPTKDLAKLMLIDSLGVMEKEAKNENEPLIYSEEDVERATNLWEQVEYHEEIKIDNVSVRLLDAGHILGSAMIEFLINNKKIVFTGDLGNPPNPLIRDTEEIKDVDYLIIESTYGDRNHESIKEANLKLERAIENTVKKGGVLMIPAFSLERTQKLLFILNNLAENRRIPRIPIFLDSPLAIQATEIYRNYQRYYNEKAKEIIRSGDRLFDFPGLQFTFTTEESKSIAKVPPPKVIIAGSGMSNGGRIIHHEKLYLPDPKSTLLLVGYQVVGSLGRLLQEGEKVVKILGEEVYVQAKIEQIRGYSAHPDKNQLFDFVSQTEDTLKKVFVVQGEPKSSLFFVQRLRDYLCLDAVAPSIGESFELDV